MVYSLEECSKLLNNVVQSRTEHYLEAYLVDPAELSFYISGQRGPVGAVEAERREEGVVGPAVQGPVPGEKWRET